MSYAIIKSIKIADNWVLITSASNNVIPRTPHEWECPSLSLVLQKEGKSKVELEIMKDYESGNFQGGANKYTRALAVLRHLPEYQEFDWRGSTWNESQKNRTEREKEFEALLIQALNTRLPKTKYVIIKQADGQSAYFRHRKGASFCKWYYEQSKATVFKYLADAEKTKTYFTNSKDWEIKLLTQ